MGFATLILDELSSGGQTIIEKLESVRSEAKFAVVLAMPDDEGHRKDHPDEKALRAATRSYDGGGAPNFLVWAGFMQRSR